MLPIFLDRAAEFYVVLSRARALAASCQCQQLDEAQRLRNSIHQACLETGLKVEDLGLSFCALVDAHALVGRTVTGSYSIDLDQALDQRRRLLEARSQGWQQLRREWVYVMKVAGPARPRAWQCTASPERGAGGRARCRCRSRRPCRPG